MPRYEVTAGHRSLARRLRKDATTLEQALWQQLRDRRLDGCKFRRQVPLAGTVADFVCFEAKLIVEVDGPLHAREMSGCTIGSATASFGSAASGS